MKVPFIAETCDLCISLWNTTGYYNLIYYINVFRFFVLPIDNFPAFTIETCTKYFSLWFFLLWQSFEKVDNIFFFLFTNFHLFTNKPSPRNSQNGAEIRKICKKIRDPFRDSEMFCFENYFTSKTTSLVKLKFAVDDSNRN